MFLFMNDFLPDCLFAVVVIKCFMIGVNVWWVYLAPQNIPRAISVLALGNSYIVLKLYWILYCIELGPANELCEQVMAHWDNGALKSKK